MESIKENSRTRNSMVKVGSSTQMETVMKAILNMVFKRDLVSLSILQATITKANLKMGSLMDKECIRIPTARSTKEVSKTKRKMAKAHTTSHQGIGLKAPSRMIKSTAMARCTILMAP